MVHMYRRESKHQARITRQTAARAAKERKRLSAVHPDLRHVIAITDYDRYTPTTHFIGLYAVLAFIDI
jgi:hypothetical protein